MHEMKKKRVHASTLKMRLMHGVEKQELMHHFLGSAGWAASPSDPRDVVPHDEGTRVCGE